MRIEPVDDARFLELADAAGVELPLEQTPAWTAFDASVTGRFPWGRLAAFEDGSPSPVALVALTRYQGRGFTYLWARHAPVWLDMHDVPTVQRERDLRSALVTYLRSHAREDTFVRLDAWHEASDLKPLLQSVTYDRTVTIDLTVGEADYLASLSKKFRYTVRQALSRDDVTVAHEPNMTEEQFAELYEVYLETAERDGFGIYDASVYWSMIEGLGAHAHVWVARLAGDPRDRRSAIAWAIFTVHGSRAQYVYAAGNALARNTDAAVRLLWEAARSFRASGLKELDLMGVDSALAPRLAGVGVFKRKWGEPVVVAPAWDVPLKPWRYRLLTAALRIKRALRR
jgi:hypothetical protein